MTIGFISTRFAGTDGVSLEARKMAAVLREMGHYCTFCAGQLDPDLPGKQVSELHFTDPIAASLHNRAFQADSSDPPLLGDIHERAQELKPRIRQFLQDFRPDYLIIQNALAIPMQLPLAQAITEVLAETGLPAMAHNHDLYWERKRFQASQIEEFLQGYFPPKLPGLRHVVINSAAKRALKSRLGLRSLVIPNVFDFAQSPPGIDEYNADFREAIGLTPNDWLILQPTRVIPRKGIELSVELVARLSDPRAKLIVTHEAGDEGLEYLHRLKELAHSKGVDFRHVSGQIGDRRGRSASGRKIYSLWDAYLHADLVAYPSIIEGFGNALLEAVYFKRPVLVNRYPVYVEDIGPLGFEFVEIDGAITDEAVGATRAWLANPDDWKPAVERNFRLASRHFSFETLRDLLRVLL